MNEDSEIQTSSSDPIALDYAPVETRATKRWHAGTLTYTFGGLVALFFWLLWGDFALNMKERSVPPALQVLLTKFHASDEMLARLTTSMPLVMGLMLTPIVSYHSDRFRSKWGRRIPFLFATAPLAFFSMIGLAYSPVIGTRIARWLGSANPDTAVIYSFAVCWGIFELSSIVVAHVVLPGLIKDVVPQEVLGRFYGLFRMVSLGAGMLFFWFLMGSVKQHYVAIFLSFAALYAGSFMIVCLMVKEGALPPPPLSEVAPHGTRVARLVDAIVTYFQESFSTPYYYWFFGSFALAAMAFSPINTFSIRYCLSLGMSLDTYGKLSTLQLGLSFLQAYPVGWLCDRFHPLRMTIVALALYAITTLLAFLFVRNATMFGVAHVVCGTCSGFWLTATAPLGAALLPRSRFTQFLSANYIVCAVGTILIAQTLGPFLDRANHDYHYIYLWACVLITSSLIVTLVLYQRFVRLGGPKNYVAPE